MPFVKSSLPIFNLSFNKKKKTTLNLLKKKEEATAGFPTNKNNRNKHDDDDQETAAETLNCSYRSNGTTSLNCSFRSTATTCHQEQIEIDISALPALNEERNSNHDDSFASSRNSIQLPKDDNAVVPAEQGQINDVTKHSIDSPLEDSEIMENFLKDVEMYDSDDDDDSDSECSSPPGVVVRQTQGFNDSNENQQFEENEVDDFWLSEDIVLPLKQ